MNPVRQRKLILMALVSVAVCAATGLMLYALRQNISFFYTPSQVALKEAPLHHSIRVGGMVVKGSVQRNTHNLWVHFTLTDYKHVLDVKYYGILPDLFREGQGIVAQGQLQDAHHFSACQVLAKHDEKYMPPELKGTLKKVHV